MASQLGRRSIGALIRQGWNEMPEIVICCGMAASALVLASGGIYIRNKHWEKLFQYRHHYEVVRPDEVEDPKKDIYN